MTVKTLNILVFIVLLILTIPAQLIGRFVASLILVLYSIFGRPEGQDNIFPFGLAPEIGYLILQFLRENFILFAGIFVSLWLVSKIFKKRNRDINWKFLVGGYWLAHVVIIIFFLPFLGGYMLLVQANLAVIFFLAYLGLIKTLPDETESLD